MRLLLSFGLAMCLSVSFAPRLFAQTAGAYCPAALTAECLQEFADAVIAKTPKEKNAQNNLAIRYASQMIGKAPEHSAELLETFGPLANARSLLYAATKLAEQDEADHAKRAFEMALKLRVTDSARPRSKTQDLLHLASAMAEHGFLDLAKETHASAIEFLPGDVRSPILLSDEQRLARLTGLYGWPELAEPWFGRAYERILEMPPQSLNRGYTITGFMRVALIIGDEDLASRAQRDLADFYAQAPQKVIDQVRKSEISALAEAGQVATAQAKAASYGLTLADVLTSAHLFFSVEAGYVPGIFPDTLDRFEAMLAALETERAKGNFLTSLARKMIEKDAYEGIETLLQRVTDPVARSELVLELMIYNAREIDKPSVAAELFFTESPDLTPRIPEMGTEHERYPLSLTARGLWEMGDTERAAQMTSVVLRLWAEDKSKDRLVEHSLMRAIAEAGADHFIDEWLAAATAPMDKVSILSVAAGGAAQGARFEQSWSYLARGREILPIISNEKKPLAAWQTPTATRPTDRERSSEELDAEESLIVRYLAQNDRLDEALAAWSKAPVAKGADWHTRLALADAAVRAGQTEQALAVRKSILDDLLAGEISARMLPGVVLGLHP